MVILLACEDEKIGEKIDHPLFRARIVVNLANKQYWYWEWRMVKLIVN